MRLAAVSASPMRVPTVVVIVAIIGVVPIIMGIWGRCLLQFVSGGSKA